MSSGQLQYIQSHADCEGQLIITLDGAQCNACDYRMKETWLVVVACENACPACSSNVMIGDTDGHRECVICGSKFSPAGQWHWIESSSHGALLVNHIGEVL